MSVSRSRVGRVALELAGLSLVAGTALIACSLNPDGGLFGWDQCTPEEWVDAGAKEVSALVPAGAQDVEIAVASLECQRPTSPRPCSSFRASRTTN